MGQMTAGQVLAQVDDLLPNSYPREQKRRWLRQAEGFVLEEVVRVHEGGQGAVLPGELTDAAELLAPAPYDGAVPPLCGGPDPLCQRGAGAV